MVVVASMLIIRELWPRSVTSQTASNSPASTVPAQVVSVAGAPSMGSATAPTMMVIYADFQCPFCGTFARDTLPAIKSRYVDKGVLMVVFRHFPLEGAHPLAVPAAVAGLCAAQQGRFWEWHDALFTSVSTPDRLALRRIAADLKLDRPSFDECVDGPEALAQIRRDVQGAVALGIRGTPTFIVGTRRNSSEIEPKAMFSGSRPLLEFRRVLDELLAQSQSR